MSTPRTIREYLDQLREALRGADPALIQDALYDAEEHLRAELAEQPGRSEAQMLNVIVGSYGAPDEVAAIYREQEVTVQRALRPPRPLKRRSLPGRFFGVAADPRTWGAVFYMLLALATGIFYFTWTVVGLSLSAGLSILIIGIPIIVLFFGSVRLFALVEGRIVESMLGVRMPRRPAYPTRGLPWLKRVGAMFSDPRTWSTLLYLVLMLPLGIVYFTLTVTLLSVSLAFAGAPVAWALGTAFWSDWFVDRDVTINLGLGAHAPFWGDALLLCIVGVLLLFASLHLLRALGRMQGHLARHLLVARGA